MAETTENEEEEEDWSRYYEVMSDEERAAWEARRQHLKRLQHITPERYDLIMLALSSLVENCTGEDERGHVYCNFCLVQQPDWPEEGPEEGVHEEACLVLAVHKLLKELDEEPHPPSPVAPSPH